ncbi:LOW QUALITY PROTEIN: protein S100-A13 [Microtus ochrogaster]|uniref:LOW QUALITY PROTEIN: protein S100-A13 n=2 Tax=Arvicolinae TaxID=39087 RepID=A0ABM0LJB4_MICOH|nr:LOW QUALITY PROTEIN: protein S100-A13 [Microtus ochrogaster]
MGPSDPSSSGCVLVAWSSVGMASDSRGGPLFRISGGGNLTLRTWEWLSSSLVLKNFSLEAPAQLAASYLPSPGELVCEDVSSCFAVLMAAEPLSELEAAIETVVTTFFTFAGREGRKGSLSLNEFKELVTQQLPHLLKDVGSLDEKMKSLDVNQDSELKFNEYWRLIGELAKEIRKEKALEIRKK